MRRHRTNFRRKSRKNNEEGIVIALVAAFMLVVIGAMMALSIDVVTFYTARSEAQLAADASALAAARVLANSGVTSNSTTSSAEALATKVAKEVAKGNSVGGANINPATNPGTGITVAFNNAAPNYDLDPHVTVTVTRTDLPTFFARILGTQQVTVTASATAEAYNPSSPSAAALRDGPPVSPICVKPWLLPNLDPTQAAGGTAPIFDPVNGYIPNPGLVGQEWPSSTPGLNQNGLHALCSDCSGSIPAPSPGGYYPGAIDAADFPVPTALPNCPSIAKPYQFAIAGCVQKPISCGSTLPINIDPLPYPTNRDADTLDAASCLIHYSAAGDSDSIDTPITPPFQFVAGSLNPIVGARGDQVMVSDSLVTIPVINNPPGTPVNPVQVIGFIQVFLNPQVVALPAPPPAGPNQIPATIINIAGCGTAAAGITPVIGNGASPVAVRLISGP